MPEKTNSLRYRSLNFENEKSLQLKVATSDLWRHRQFSDVFIRREVPVGACIPDIICVRFFDFPDPNFWPKRWTYRHTFVLWLLRRWHRLKLLSIAQRTYEDPDKIMLILDELTRCGAIVKTSTGSFMLSTKMRNLRADIISVEVKLYRWKEALEQAKIYKNFSDSSFVAMDSNGIPKNPEIISIFQKNRVGLCAVSNEAINWIVPPYPSQIKNGPDREYLISGAASYTQTLWSRL
jgi:hypothetical protein